MEKKGKQEKERGERKWEVQRGELAELPPPTNGVGVAGRYGFYDIPGNGESSIRKVKGQSLSLSRR